VLRGAFRLIVVDEYQDTDPAQVMLLKELARGGAQVVAVGDPDQAIYGFRGADVRGILTFAEEFRDPATGAPARIEVLRTTRRFPEPIARAAHGVLGPVPLTGLPADVQRLHRTPSTAQGPARVSMALGKGLTVSLDSVTLIVSGPGMETISNVYLPNTYGASLEWLGNLSKENTPSGEINPFGDNRITGRLNVAWKIFGNGSLGLNFRALYNTAPAVKPPPPGFTWAPGYLPLADRWDTTTELVLLYKLL
jgi:hypothetical protein